MDSRHLLARLSVPRGSCAVEYAQETRCHQGLTSDHTDAIDTWAPSQLPPGQALRKPARLFEKLDESLIEEEYARMEG